MKVRATVEYDGTHFSGFQRQADARSVQGEIERALENISGAPIGIVGAGRTDAGVHATGQVIAFEIDWSHALTDLRSALNVTLDADVAIRDVAVCAADFHPRYSALSRTYEYAIERVEARRPLRRLYAWQVFRELDSARMNEAAQMLLGERDFAAFGSPPSGSGDSTVRRILRADWRSENGRWVFAIEANAFLFRMVRRIVVTLERVGRGELSAADVAEILASRDASRVKGVAPACGLVLTRVKYESDEK